MEVEGRFRTEGIYVYTRLSHVVVWQKLTQHCEAPPEERKSENTVRRQLSSSQEQPSPEPTPPLKPGHLDLGLLPSRTLKNKCMLFQAPFMWYCILVVLAEEYSFPTFYKFYNDLPF